MKRTPAAAGSFYPANSAALEKLVKELTPSYGGSLTKAVGIVAPHAGYMYSGSVAGKVYAAITIPATVIVIGPNHTGYGARAGIISDGTFSMPGFEIEIDEELAKAIVNNTNIITEDYDSHIQEHSLEVQLPFIHYRNPSAMLVPISVMGRNYDFASSIGSAIAKAIKETNKDVLVIASSDMTHYEADETARKKDKLAIEKLIELDAAGLLKVTAEHDISMCGVIPAAIMLTIAQKLGAENAKLIDYKTSGEVTHDYDEVVGYAGIVVY